MYAEMTVMNSRFSSLLVSLIAYLEWSYAVTSKSEEGLLAISAFVLESDAFGPSITFSD